MFDICTSIPVFCLLSFVFCLLARESHVLSVLFALIYDLTNARPFSLLSAASCLPYLVILHTSNTGVIY